MGVPVSIIALMQGAGVVLTVCKGVFDLIVGFTERRKTQKYEHRTQATLQDVQNHQQHTEATLYKAQHHTNATLQDTQKHQQQRTEATLTEVQFQLLEWSDLWATLEEGRLLQVQQLTATEHIMRTMLLFISTMLLYHHLTQHQPFISLHVDILRIPDYQITSIMFLASSSCYIFYSSRWSQLASITLGSMLVVKPLLLQGLWLSEYASAIFLTCYLGVVGTSVMTCELLGGTEDQGKSAVRLVWGATQPICALLSSVQLYKLLVAMAYTGLSFSIVIQPQLWCALAAFSQAGFAMSATVLFHTEVEITNAVHGWLLRLAGTFTLATLLGSYILYCLQHMLLRPVNRVAGYSWQALGPMLGLLAKYDAWLVLASVGQAVLILIDKNTVRPRHAVIFAVCMIAVGKSCMDVAGLPLTELLWSVSWWWKLLALFGSFTWAVAILLYWEEERAADVMFPGILCHFLAAVVLFSSWAIPMVRDGNGFN